MLSSVIAGAAVLVAAVAFERARRVSKRLERLRESYWDLRYELGQLQARVHRLEPEQRESSSAPPPTAATAFVPLSSLKR
jgi:hypothetical protein